MFKKLSRVKEICSKVIKTSAVVGLTALGIGTAASLLQDRKECNKERN